jgi:hypothetical protein
MFYGPKTIFSLLFYFAGQLTFAQSGCNLNNQNFKAGESLTYEIYYSWGLIWMPSGSVTFKVEQDVYREKACYKISGNGKSYPKYDWFYKVRDKYESYVDTVSLKPFRFFRDVSEGGAKVHDDNYFDYINGTAISIIKKNDGPLKVDTVKINYCTFDVMSMIYFSRTIDFSKYKAGDKIPISLYLDNEVHYLYIKYVGKEVLKTAFGTFNCIKFKPKLVPGSIFKEGDEMTVWVTDDKNKIPLYVESPITVGTIKVKLKSFSEIKNPFTSIVIPSK